MRLTCWCGALRAWASSYVVVPRLVSAERSGLRGADAVTRVDIHRTAYHSR